MSESKIEDWYLPPVKICARKIDDGWTVGSLSEEGTEHKLWWPIKDCATEQEAKEYITSNYGFRGNENKE